MGNSTSLERKRYAKSLMATAFVAFGLFLGEIIVTSSKSTFEKALSVLPDSVRQEYLDYVLSVEYGPFRTYTHKVNALHALQHRIKQGSPLAYDPVVPLGLLEGGMDGHWEPIPVSAATLILLENQPRVYDELFRLYREDAETLDQFKGWTERMRELEPLRYPEMRRAVDAAEKKSSLTQPRAVDTMAAGSP